MKNEHKIALIAMLSGVSIGLTICIALVISGKVNFFGLNQRNDKLKIETVAAEETGEISETGVAADMGTATGIATEYTYSDSSTGILDNLFQNNCTLQHEVELEQNHFQEISVNFKDTPFDVKFAVSEDGKIKIEEYFNMQVEEEQFAKIEINQGKLNLTQKYSKKKDNAYLNGNAYRYGFWGYTIIYLPADVYEELTKLNILTTSGDIQLPQWDGKYASMKEAKLKSVSGDMEIHKLRADDLILLESTSGDMEINTLSANSIQMSSTSGDISGVQADGKEIIISQTSGYLDFGAINGENTAISTTSGDLEVESGTGQFIVETSSGYQTIDRFVGNLKITSTSGDIQVGSVQGAVKGSTQSGYLTIEDLKGSGKFNTTSGDIEVDFSRLEGDISINTSSGYVDLELPADAGFQLKINTTSGDIYTSFDDELSFNKKGNSAEGSVGPDTGYKIYISSTSGDVTIN